MASIVPFGEVRDGRQVQYGNDSVFALFNVVGAGYFSTLRLPVVAGREFTAIEEQDAASEPVAIVDLALTRRLFAGTNAIGQSIRLSGFNQPDELVRIVGVVGDVRDDVLQPPGAHVYVSFGRHYRSAMTLHVRTAPGTETVTLESVRNAIQSVDPRLPVLSLKTLTNHRDSDDQSVGGDAGSKTLRGVRAHRWRAGNCRCLRTARVSRDTAETGDGIRMALGGTRGNILGQLLREGSWMAVTGLLVGTVLAVGLIQVLQRSGMLYQVDTLDPLVFAVAPLLLASATAAASYIPASRPRA